MNTQVNVIENSDEMPLCPHCKKELRSVSTRRLQGKLGVRFIYFCSQCRNTLGISHRKGFWMG